jgi:hypothetical protein
MNRMKSELSTVMDGAEELTREEIERRLKRLNAHTQQVNRRQTQDFLKDAREAYEQELKKEKQIIADHNKKDKDGVNQAPSGSYMEIARCFNFWQNTGLAPLSLQAEYNGLVGVNQNFLFGLDYFLHNANFSNTFNFKVLYKTFSAGATSDIPVQFTFVWGMQDLFGVKGLRFSGFADFFLSIINAFYQFSQFGYSVL